VKADSGGRTLLAAGNVVLALSVLIVTYRLFFVTQHDDLAETCERCRKEKPSLRFFTTQHLEKAELIARIDPRAFEVRVAQKPPKAEEYRRAWEELDRPKPVAAPPPEPVKPAGPPPVGDLDNIFQVVCVFIDGDPSRSSVVLKRRSGPDEQVQVGIGDKLENAYEIRSISPHEDRSVTVEILDQQGNPCRVKLTRDQVAGGGS
jgi:hypothetical protein